MREKYIAYLITNVVNGKIYVGATSQRLGKRWIQHRSAAKNGRKTPLHNAIQKYGANNFLVEHIATAQSYDALILLEVDLIAQHRCLVPQGGYNVLPGGVLTSEEAARKGSLKIIGKPRPAHVKMVLSKLAKGRRHTLEARQKMSASGCGKRKSDQWKRSATEAWNTRRGAKLKGASKNNAGTWNAWAYSGGKTKYLGRFATEIAAHLASVRYGSSEAN